MVEALGPEAQWQVVSKLDGEGTWNHGCEHPPVTSQLGAALLAFAAGVSCLVLASAMSLSHASL